jgi:NAD(P)-dependent dehydrogenase (short-subunit alcohol dehydrogenase family)
MLSKSLNTLFGLHGRTALVTGGSRGLGLQMARALGEAGASIVLSSRKEEDLEAAVKELKVFGIDASWVAGDCSDEQDIKNIVDKTLNRFDGKLDILVNNAGATWGANTEDHPVDAFDKVMNLNIRGYFLLSKEVGKRAMIPQKSGKIINISSIAGLGGNPKGLNMIAYNTSKGAVINFTKTLGGEWGVHNINVNAICPGFFPTKMTRATLRKLGVDNMTQRVPLCRLGDDEDLKGVTLLFASDAGKHLTGQFIAALFSLYLFATTYSSAVLSCRSTYCCRWWRINDIWLT